MILGICGNKGAGKSTLAQLLLELVPGARTIAFADPLKEFVAQIYDWPREKLEDQEFKETPDPRYTRLSKGQIATLNWDNLIDDWHAGRRPEANLHEALGLTLEEYVDWVKTGVVHLTPRFAMKTLGTEWGRGCWRLTWIAVGMRRAVELERDGCPLVIVTDVRFINESQAITCAVGKVVRIAGGMGTIDNHGSEREVMSVPTNYTIQNNYDLESLRVSAMSLLDELNVPYREAGNAHFE